MTTIQSQPRVPYPLAIPSRDIRAGCRATQPESAPLRGAAPNSRPQTAKAGPDAAVLTPLSVPVSAGPEPKKPGVVRRLTSSGHPARRQMSHDSVNSSGSEASSTGPLHTPPVSATPSVDEKKGASFMDRFSMAKLTRRPSNTSSTNRSCNDTASLQQKYGVCAKGCIGKGATAVVRLVHHLDRTTRNEKLYAVKEFRKRRKDESEREYVKKLTSEFCISSSLRHPNIVETVDLVQDQQQRWCQVMEYCPGGDLYTVIREGTMAAPEVHCCFKQLIHGVAHMHSMGVAHRDIKPENLLLDAYGHVKVTDFGVADVFRVCWEKTTHLSRGFCGSEPYIAPEQFANKPYDARKVDIWSCAVVLYAMYCKGVPFRTATKHDPNYVRYLDARSQNKPYPPFRKLPPPVASLLYRMLEPDPEKRISVQDIVKTPWFESIEVCTNGRTETQQEHHHYTEEYVLNLLKHSRR
ncbi:hypothetical protein H4R34_002980 [Dimargaris verticillata]|uniref:non-specific serine/threonine protein kinase n=1 Tax=Dimargaris verticillata TaxID=2761393 RepID=A0A9W8B0U8_9FUNG|nr:hypothetical protein H4R34_002980 [Dimargaris verticillata]